MATFKITFEASRRTLDATATALTEILQPAVQAVSLTKIDEDALDDQAPWRLEAYFAGPPDLKAIEAALADLGGLSAAALEELPDIDWVAHSLEGLGIVRAGRFVLYGAHDAERLPNEKDDIPIRIDANEAFGTGHHPTTAGCLELLHRLGGLRPRSILDLGTGSGVLAIAAAALWSRAVLAADIDKRSVEIARENAALNGLADLVEVIECDGFAHPRARERAPFDFVFANILAGPLIDLAGAMAAHIASRGRLIVGGLMKDQEAHVASAYQAAGFRLLNRVDHAAWPVLMFAKTRGIAGQA